MKRYTILGIIVIVSLGLWNTHLMAADIEAVLDSTDGSSSFVVQDSTPTTMGAVDSDGNMVIKGGMRLDSAGVECTTAENLIVDGSVGIGTTSPGTKLEVDGVITATGGTSTNWNTAYTDRLNWNGGTTGLTAATGRSSLGLGSLATLSTVAAATITDNTVGAAELNVSGNGTNAQYLRSDADGTFTWATPTDTNTDIYWTGTSTNLTASTGRSSLGLGSLATLSTVAAATITDNTVGSAELVASPAFTNPTCATPSSSTHVANKAYVDAASGGGCYSKCADSGTAAGGATPTCAAGYTSVDTWSERAGYAMKQWQGMNSAAYSTGATGPTYSGPTTGTTSKTFTYGWNIGDTDAWGRTFNYSVAIPWAYKSAYYGKWAWNTGYTGGSSTANYYNDCTACCAD